MNTNVHDHQRTNNVSVGGLVKHLFLLLLLLLLLLLVLLLLLLLLLLVLLLLLKLIEAVLNYNFFLAFLFQSEIFNEIDLKGCSVAETSHKNINCSFSVSHIFVLSVGKRLSLGTVA